MNWQFFIDVGGTFTDVVARRPDDTLVTHKLLSSSAVRGTAEPGSTATAIRDHRRIGDPKDFWVGYRVTLFGDWPSSNVDWRSKPTVAPSAVVARFDAQRGELFLDQPLQNAERRMANSEVGSTGRTKNAAWTNEFAHATRTVTIQYELRSDEEAPVFAIRYLMGLARNDPIGPVDIRLGTTRATNALLERKGAAVALVTTKGFADILRIGYQDRPALFELNITKRDELTSRIVEIDERMSASGEVLRALSKPAVRGQLRALQETGVETLAVCLLHAHVNPAHEELVAEIARPLGFRHISISSRVARMEKIVPRGDTTVLDAYLAPVIGDYIASLQRSMPEARIRLMTSHGGLMTAGSVSGKDTLLSGPAGGVVGCAAAAQAAGFDRTIGFDMGGTSTDVSRIEPPPHRFDYQYETVKASIRLVTPMLAVETVAAGGGSICEFDGQKLVVGPHSAGADPGPACYGRGGPLTVTDMNLFLGRMAPEYFPFRLDRAVVGRKLEALAERVYQAREFRLSTIELAEGFLQIANASMADAIKRISIAKGFDAREYTLTTFGGAGAQHACAIASMLGISRILWSPFAGVLSAVGVGVAEEKRIRQRSVYYRLDGNQVDAGDHNALHSRPSAGASHADRPPKRPYSQQGTLPDGRVLDGRALGDEVQAYGDGRLLDRATLDRTFESITSDLRRALIHEGVDPARLLAPALTVDVCYAGQATLITVPADPFDQLRERFEARHRQYYGYRHEGRPIEIRVVRVEQAAHSTAAAPWEGAILSRDRQGAAPQAAGAAANATVSVEHPSRVTEMVVAGQFRPAPLYLRRDLTPGRRFPGPAVIASDTSTVVVDPGWEAEVREAGCLVLTAVVDSAQAGMPAYGRVSEEPVRTATVRERPPAGRSASDRGVSQATAGVDRAGEEAGESVQAPGRSGREVDPIQLELFNNRFTAVAQAMGTTLRRTALSVNVKERLDFSCAIFTPEGDLVVNAPHIPVHLGGMSDCVKALMEDVRTFSPGDVYVTNDPYRGGSHLNDVTVITPVHDASKSEILFFVASRAHHAEIGGTRPGSMPPDSTSLAEEGVLIPATAWLKGGEPQHEQLRKWLTSGPYPSRAPDDNLADIAAQVAANQTGVRELCGMVERYGAVSVQYYMRCIQAAAEQKMRRALRRLPDGVHRFEDRLDDGSPIRLAVTVRADRATLDFSGTGGVLPGNLNANRSIVTSCVLYCLRCLIHEDIPLNAGVLAPIEIMLPECFLNPPREGRRTGAGEETLPPVLVTERDPGDRDGTRPHDHRARPSVDPRCLPAVAGGNVETSQRIVDCIFGALKTVAASCGTMNNVLIGNDRFGYYETICGGAGAGSGFDGADAVHTHMTNTRLTDPEVLERQVPVRLIRFAIRRGSGGRGKFRGGCGVVREFEFLEPLEVSILSQRRVTAPYGRFGGKDGQSGRNLLRRRGSVAVETLPPITRIAVQPGDRLTIETPGGGGWGAAE